MVFCEASFFGLSNLIRSDSSHCTGSTHIVKENVLGSFVEVVTAEDSVIQSGGSITVDQLQY